MLPDGYSDVPPGKIRLMASPTGAKSVVSTPVQKSRQGRRAKVKISRLSGLDPAATADVSVDGVFPLRYKGQTFAN